MERVRLLKGDITTLLVDAVVNAANSSLLGGGGVDGAIHRAGGPAIMQACSEIGFCPTGEAVITTGGNLPAKFVIHAVGPVWQSGDFDESDFLQKAYTNSLILALKNGITSIAFPNISTGIYGFPKPQAAKIAINSVLQFLNKNKTAMEIYFVCYDEENFRIYESLFSEGYTL